MIMSNMTDDFSEKQKTGFRKLLDIMFEYDINIVSEDPYCGVDVIIGGKFVPRNIEEIERIINLSPND